MKLTKNEVTKMKTEIKNKSLFKLLMTTIVVYKND